jgi:O-antigen/teichoic acid export membrane protein
MSTLKLLLIGLGSRITIMAVGMVNTILLARSLGPAGVGEYFLLVRLVAVLTVLADFGLSKSANVFSGNHEEWSSRIQQILLRFMLRSWLGVSIVGIGVLWLARDMLLRGFPLKWIWIAFLLLLPSLYANFWNAIMIGKGRIWQLNLVQLVGSATSLILITVFVIGFSGGVLAAVMIYSLTTVIQVVMMIIIAYRSSSGRDLGDAPADLPRQMLSFGLRAHPALLSSLLWANSPVFLLNAFHGAVAVGIYSVAQQIVEKLLLPIQAMQDAIFKKISLLPHQAATVTMNRYVRVTWWVTAISMLIGLLVVPWVVIAFLGEKYIRAAEVCRLLLPGTAAMSVPTLLTAYFLTTVRRPGLLSILWWLNASINIILSLLLIPRLAESGAALAMTISQIFGTSCVLILYLRASQTPIRELVFINNEDFATIRQQVATILRRKGGGE